MTNSTYTIDVFSEAFMESSEQILGAMREPDPVWRWEEGGAWVVTAYEPCVQALKDERLTMDPKFWENAPEDTEGMPFTPMGKYSEKSLISAGRADHIRMRRVLSRMFTPRAIERQRSVIAELVDAALADLDGLDNIDLVADFASTLPTTIISRILGIPAEHRDDFRRYARVVVRNHSPLATEEDRAEAVDAIPAFYELTASLIEQKRVDPTEDGLSDLIAAQVDEGRLDVEELFSLVATLLIAGSETVSHQIPMCVLDLLRNPDQLDLLRTDPTLWPNAVLELVRHFFIGNWTLRFAKEDAEIGGQAISKGQLVLVALNAANRDPSVFDDPDRLDVTRDVSRAITFGRGPHFCAGAALAQVQLAVTLERLTNRFPEMTLSGKPTYTTNFMTRTLTSLPLAVR